MRKLKALIKAQGEGGIRTRGSKGRGQNTALMAAAFRGWVPAVKALVDADPDAAHLQMRVSIP